MTLAMGIIKGWGHLNALEIIRHPWFVSAFLAGGLAQAIKLATGWVRTRRLDLHGLVEPGGMPSAHSALVTALAVAVGLTEGFDAPDAMIAVGLGTITMADAVSIRRAAGEHARLLNRIAARLDALDGVTTTIKGAQTATPVIWITGDTDRHADALTAAGAKWSNKKSAYYVRVA